MKTNHRMRRGFTLIELLVVIAIIATLAGVGVPMILAQQKKGARTEAMRNAKEIALAMFTFDQDYGTFPSPTTATEVKDKTGSSIDMTGNTSNAYFRQLIAAGIIESENNFYAKAAYTKKPDNVMSASKALAAGEVGFGYIMASATEALSSSGNSGPPLLVAATLDAATNGTFDLDVYDKKAVVLRIDQSVKLENIRPTDKMCTIGGGKTLLESGPDTVWDTLTPVLVAPIKAGN